MKKIELITTEEAAKIAKVSTRTIYKWLSYHESDTGTIPPVVIYYGSSGPVIFKSSRDFRSVKLNGRRYIEKNSFIKALKLAGRL